MSFVIEASVHVKVPPRDFRGRFFAELTREWNADILAFRAFMQDRHLSGGTTADRLARRSSNLYNSLTHSTEVVGDEIKARIGFLAAVKGYALVHEYGSALRNIPPRMNMRAEWSRIEPYFADRTRAVVGGIFDSDAS
jgi:hypothetical protein